MTRMLRLRRRPSLARLMRHEQGYVLPSVIGLGLVMLLLAATATVSASSVQVKSQTTSDYSAAYYAASAGLSDYQSRLASTSNYNLYGNPSAPFSSGSAPLTLPATSDPLYNTAFGLGTSGSWTQVPCRSASCSSSTRPSYFRYEVNTKDFSTRGVIHVRSTGKSGNVTRSVIADFRRNGLFNFVYYTNFEIQDPSISGDPASCATYPWSTPARSGSCGLVQFGPYDTLNGDIFSNDQFDICGATFAGRVQSAAPAGNSPWINADGSCDQPDFTFNNGAYTPENVASISLPATNGVLSNEARADTYTGAAPGCMYTGPTSITFNGDGTMTVVSPLTKVTQPSLTTGIPSQTPTGMNGCGIPGTATGQLGSVGGATVNVPADNMIYVQSVPASSSDPNYRSISSTTNWSTTTTNNTTFSCFSQAGTLNSQLSNAPTGTMSGWKLVKTGSGAQTIRYPLSNEDLIPQPTLTAAYQCDRGDAYVSGTVQGHVTLATDRNIYVTGDIKYSSSYPTGSNYNILGLVANTALVIWNPQDYNGNQVSIGGGKYRPSSTNLLTDTNRTLSAAALAVRGTVMVQNYNGGSARGTLNLIGSIEQNYRGTVAMGSGNNPTTGYKKNYQYDTNLKYNAPPKYLAPANATYAMSQMASVPAAFKADGSTP